MSETKILTRDEYVINIITGNFGENDLQFAFDPVLLTDELRIFGLKFKVRKLYWSPLLSDEWGCPYFLEESELIDYLNQRDNSGIRWVWMTSVKGTPRYIHSIYIDNKVYSESSFNEAYSRYLESLRDIDIEKKVMTELSKVITSKLGNLNKVAKVSEGTYLRLKGSGICYNMMAGQVLSTDSVSYKDIVGKDIESVADRIITEFRRKFESRLKFWKDSIKTELPILESALN